MCMETETNRPVRAIQDENELSGGDGDDDFDEDLEALRRACMLTGAKPEGYNKPSSSPSASGKSASDGVGRISDSDDDDDLELVRNIRNRFSLLDQECRRLSLNPLSTLPAVASDEEENDFETLRAIERRFTAYNCDSSGDCMKDSLNKPEQLQAPDILLEGHSQGNNTHLPSKYVEMQPSSSTKSQQTGASRSSTVELRNSCLPKSALAFIDAIKKNRSCQKFLRGKLVHIEARIEENKELRERFKILKDFESSCKKRTGRALSQNRDPRIQLISNRKPRGSEDSLKAKDKKLSTMYYGPAENSDVANYKMALTKFPLSVEQKVWRKAEKENLGKGIKQQFQEMALQILVDRFSVAEGSAGDSNNIDKSLATIKDLDITPEMIRKFLPKVNWDKLASMYVVGRSGAECEARWSNYEDPLINHNSWSTMEDKKLLFIIQKEGINNWINIAESLGTSRTPCQCLARYQRSLNASILKRKWTKEEDDKLCVAVETFGRRDWQTVASAMEGRTGPQCSNRWKKSLDPSRTRKGSFTPDEDKRLKIAVMLFGPKNWNKKAQFILGRNQVQCRERWYNCLDPNLKRGKWTEEEDSRLEEAIRKHGYSWAKVATWVPSRTDSECRRRWTKLFPHEVPLLQEARRIQKAALIGNFVDREEERSSLGPSDFHPLPIRNLICGPESTNTSVRNTRKPSRKPVPKKEKSASCSLPKTEKFKKSGKKDGGVDTVNKRFPAQKRMQLLKFSKETNSLLDEFYSTINGTNKTKKSSKKLSRSRKTTSRTRLDQNSTGSSGMPVSTKTTNDIDHDAPSHDQDSALLQITNGEEIIGLGGNEGNNLPEESSSLSSQSRNPDKAVVASVDKSCVPQRKRKRKYETSDECQQAEHKKAKQQRLRTVDANDLTASLCGSKLIMKKPETEGIVQENLSDPQSNNLDNTLTTLACLLQDKSKNMVVALNDSGRSENDNEVGDVTLASMLRNKSKKKKPSS